MSNIETLVSEGFFLNSSDGFLQNWNNTSGNSFRYFIASVNISIGVLGSSGNLITIICITYALRRKQFGMDKDFEQNVLGLNLCFIDMVFCLLYIIPESPSYILNYWPLSLKYCQIMFLVTGMLGMTRRHILVVITILHCLKLTKNSLWLRCKQNSAILVMLIAISWLMGVFGGFADIGFQSIDTIGWNDDLGLCWLIEAGSPYYLVLYISDVLIIVICCGIIWAKLFQSEKSLARVGNSFPQYLQDEQKNKTKTISILLLCAVICNLNVLTIVISINNKPLFYAINSIYYLQYGLNILVFAGTNSRYRSMYAQGLKNLISPSKMTKECDICAVNKELIKGVKNGDCVLQRVKKY